MSIRGRISWTHVGFYLAIAILLLLLGWLFLINYWALLALLVGILLAWPARMVFLALREELRRRKLPWWTWVIFVPVVVLVLGCLMLGLLFILTLSGAGGPGEIEIEVKTVQVTIEPVDASLETFWLEEELLLDLDPLRSQLHADVQPQQRLPRQQVAAAKQGWLLREVQVEVPPSVTLPLAGGALTDTLLIYSDVRAIVELHDMPLNSFYAARDARGVETYPYLDVETIAWEAPSLDRGISFAYVQPPYQRFRTVLKPFLGASSLGEWLFALVGLVGSAVVLPIVKDVLFGVAGDKVKGWLQKLWRRKRGDGPGGEGPARDPPAELPPS